jgi:hypothetical protein
MSFEFQSTLVNVTPTYRIGGSRIGGVRIEYSGSTKVARVIVTDDADVKFALSGPFESGDPDAIYAALAADLFEITPGVLLNEGAVAKVDLDPSTLTIELDGSERRFKFLLDDEVTEATEFGDHTWKLTAAGFAALSAAAGTWRSSMDGTLEGLSTAITTEVADRIAAITAEEQRVDALIASGMWLFADQAAFPPAADNHGRVVHSHADGAIFYAHGGMWHQVAKEVDLQTTIASVANEAAAREAADTTLQANIDAEAATRQADDASELLARTNADTALSNRLDVLEADPTTAAAVAAGDAATLSSANGYTDTSITNLVNGADAALDTLKEIGDALAQGDSDVTAALTAQITTESTTRAAADTALSGRLDTLEADPTTQTLLDAETTARTSADTALDGRVTTLEGNAAITDPTTATAVAAVQSDVDANQTSSESADSALSARLDVLEADPTTATALTDGLALKAPLADPDFTGQLEVDTNARLEFDSNLTKLSNVLRGTSIVIGNNITLNPAAADGRVEIEGEFYLRPSDLTDAADDTAAAAAGVIVGQVYRNGSQLMIRVS